jgi:hypothetical protein
MLFTVIFIQYKNVWSSHIVSVNTTCLFFVAAAEGFVSIQEHEHHRQKVHIHGEVYIISYRNVCKSASTVRTNKEVLGKTDYRHKLDYSSVSKASRISLDVRAVNNSQLASEDVFLINVCLSIDYLMDFCFLHLLPTYQPRWWKESINGTLTFVLPSATLMTPGLVISILRRTRLILAFYLPLSRRKPCKYASAPRVSIWTFLSEFKGIFCAQLSMRRSTIIATVSFLSEKYITMGH